MAAGHVDAKRGGRLCAHRPHDPVQLGCDRVQRPADPVIVEHARLDPPDLLHRPRPGPVLHPHQRRRRGQPVGDQDLDDLPMGHQREVTDRAATVDDAGQIQPPAKLGDHRQRAQRLVHAGRAELGAKSSTWSHRRTLTQPTDRPTPPAKAKDPPVTMCGGQG
jgi:hypothetical protein